MRVSKTENLCVDIEHAFENFSKLARELVALADWLDENCKSEFDRERLACVYRKFLNEFMQ